mgnify:FL=1
MYKIEDIINKVHQADCLEFMKQMPDKSVDLVVTSPPYDSLRDYEGYKFDFENIAKELFRIIKDGGVMVWVVSDGTIDNEESGTSFKQALLFKENGFLLHDTMIWLKDTFSFPQNRRYHQVFEYMFVLSKGVPKTFNGIVDRKNKFAEMNVHGTMRQRDGTTISRGNLHKGIIIKDMGRRFNVCEMK